MQFSYILITFILRFYSAFASPTGGWQLSDVVGAASSSVQNNRKGYECGNDFFSDSEITEALNKYHQYVIHNPHSPLDNRTPQEHSDIPQVHSIPQEYIDFDIPPGYQSIHQLFTPKLYQGPLYSDSGSLNYILWPILKEKIIHSTSKYHSDTYYIVVKKNDRVVIDVISRIVNNNFAKCIRIDSSRTELSTSAPDINDGYLCAHRFLGDSLIQASLRLLWDSTGKFNIYPIPYIGSLYPANSDYMIWPIFSRDRLYDYSSVEPGPFFLVVDMQGNLIETVVQGLSNNFLRCTRSRIPFKRQSSNVPNRSSALAPNVQFGYYCDMIFFSDKAVTEATAMAKYSKKVSIYSKYPIDYQCDLFDEPLLLWPLMKNGDYYEKGSPGRHRVILTKDYRIKGVGIMQASTIQLCEKGKKSEIKDHEKSDFLCIDHIVHNHDLQNAAKNGCDIFHKGSQRFYPAKYVGPDFEKSGPYFTYPVLAGRNFLFNSGPDRVVMNANCEVVGAITYFPKPTKGDRSDTFALCIKPQERTETKTYILHKEPIYERRWGNPTF